MNQITRINKYEKILNDATKRVKKYEKSLTEFDDIQKELKELSDYYGSSDWYKDFDDYDNGQLPDDIKAGILSEDAIYNLLENNHELALEMLEVATKILNNKEF